MATVTIRNLDEVVKGRLRMRAAAHGRSMESEIRAILSDAVEEPDGQDNPFLTLLDRFSSIGGVDLDLPSRSTPVRPADLPE